jgi:hypothetical protein
VRAAAAAASRVWPGHSARDAAGAPAAAAGGEEGEEGEEGGRAHGPALLGLLQLAAAENYSLRQQLEAAQMQVRARPLACVVGGRCSRAAFRHAACCKEAGGAGARRAPTSTPPARHQPRPPTTATTTLPSPARPPPAPAQLLDLQARLLQVSAAEEAARRASSQKAASISELAMSESEALAAVAALRARLELEVGRNVALEVERAAGAAAGAELGRLARYKARARDLERLAGFQKAQLQEYQCAAPAWAPPACAPLPGPHLPARPRLGPACLRAPACGVPACPCRAPAEGRPACLQAHHVACHTPALHAARTRRTPAAPAPPHTSRPRAARRCALKEERRAYARLLNELRALRAAAAVPYSAAYDAPDGGAGGSQPATPLARGSAGANGSSSKFARRVFSLVKPGGAVAEGGEGLEEGGEGGDDRKWWRKLGPAHK